MKTFSGFVSVAVLLACGGSRLAAQQVLPADTGTIVVNDPVQQGREIIEDVEVLRTILAREVRALYAPAEADASGGGAAATGFGTSFDPLSGPGGGTRLGAGMMMESMGGMPGMSMNIPAMGQMGGGAYGGPAAPAPATSVGPLGAYVEGLGIVYQLELPALREPPPAEDEADVSECTWLARTDWQRTRAVMRGELTIADCQKCHDASTMTGGGSPSAPPRATLREFLNQVSSGKQRDAERTSGGPTRAHLTETLVDLLAKYGQHVRHLAPDERIAVAVNIRPEAPPTGAMMGASGYGSGGRYGDFDGDYGSGGYGGMSGAPAGGGAGAADYAPPQGGGPGGPSSYGAEGGYGSGGAGSAGGQFDSGYGGSGEAASGGSGSGYGLGGSSSGASSGAGPAGGRGISGLSGAGAGAGSAFGAVRSASGGGAGLTGEAGSDELSGDLYLRQGRADEAAAAYERALLNAHGMAEAGPGAAVPPHAVLSSLFGQGWQPDRGLIQKLLQAYAAAGNLDKARIVLEKWTDKSASGTSSRADAAGATRAVPLPARLVVSASKEQLDAVASGKLPRDEFEKQALVRWFDPQAPDGRLSVKSQPAKLSGVVVDVADEMVEISLGTEDGLRRGAMLHISRSGSMVATAEIVRVGADRSTARVTSVADNNEEAEIGVKHGDIVILPPRAESEQDPAHAP